MEGIESGEGLDTSGAWPQQVTHFQLTRSSLVSREESSLGSG